MTNGAPPDIEMKPWRERSNTIGILPGKANEQTEPLRRVISQLPLPSGSRIELLSAQGEPKSLACDSLCRNQLTRGALVMRGADFEWVATNAARHWFESDDSAFLARHLHANVKLFGELLAAVDDETRTADLLQLAGGYGLNWESPDQIFRRLGWLQSLGLVERWGFSRLVVTEQGRDFLSSIELCQPEEALGQGSNGNEEPAEMIEASASVAEAIADLDSRKLAERKVLIGYIPRGQKVSGRPTGSGQAGVLEAMRNFVELLGNGASTDELFRRANEQLGLKKSSFTQSMHTFRNMRLIDMVSFNRYALTREGETLLQAGSEVDLVRFLHTRYRFVGELLACLESTTPVAKLVAVANEQFGCHQIDGTEIRRRLSLMADAGLVERVDWTRYRSTPTGRLLAEELLLESPTTANSAPQQESPVDGPVHGALDQTSADLRRCSRLGDATSSDFEQAVARAFELFGFRSEHLGGSGRTDVLVTVELSAADSFRSIVDAKASATGLIGDNSIKFDALKDHQRKHRADFGMVVGPDFSNRVKEWAANNKFTLLTVDELIGLLERHQKTPLTLPELKGLFEHSDSDLAEVEEQYDAAEDSVKILTRLVDMLYQEANEEDPVAEGFISAENLHYVLRKELTPRPSRTAIEDALQFLASPLVKAVVQRQDKYKLVDAPSNIMRRLCGLGSGLDGLSVDDGAD
ncbi:hypothetical protein ACWEV3_05105 [Saccharopolyspora sp. NPDC003752]